MVWNHTRTPAAARSTRAEVAMDVRLECRDDAGAPVGLDTVFSFSAGDPYAVTVTFRTDDGDLPWSFDRDLLIRGLDAPVGLGDVRVHPVRTALGADRVVITLTSPDGRLEASARARDVRAFLRLADRAVPAGAESDFVDVDALIGRLLQTTV